MTPRGASRFSPTRNPRRKTAATASTHVGQTDAERAARRQPTQSAAHEQVGEHRVDERDAPEDLAAVEERRARREKPSSASRSRFRIESGRRRSARPTRKTRQNAIQTYGFSSVFPPNAPVAPARHLPRDLRARPRLGDAPGRVLDDGLRDLARLARPRLHDPGPRRRVERRRRRRVRRIAVEPARDLRSRPSASRSPLASVRRASVRSGRRRAAPVEGKREREQPRARRRCASLASWSERPELVADEVHRRDEHDRDRLGEDLVRARR